MDVTKLENRIRFCAWETYDGVRRHYICGHHEYCCALGCCVSTAFSFYQLWYFWLLLLLIILVCSGGGWWFRWRYGGSLASPAQGHGRRHRRNRAGHGPRVYPHPYYTGAAANDYTLPPGYDKDPPSYNEVISHLSQFPRADTVQEEGTSAAGGEPVGPSAPPDDQLASPPPYEMILDIKRREVQLTREIAEEERTERSGSTRGRIRNLLGRVRPKKTSPEAPPPPPPLEAYVASSSSQGATTPPALFTISRENLPPPPPPYGYYASSPSNTSSHSDYSSSFVSSPSSSSSSSRSLSTVSSPGPSDHLPHPPLRTPEPQEQNHSEEDEEDEEALEHAGTSRPCTGRSILSRPTTSISTRTLPPPPQLVRKTSLPGAVVENEEADK